MPPIRLTNDTLARIRVCLRAGIPASPELLANVVECLESMAAASVRRRCCGELIRRAALMLTGSPYRKAQVLQAEIKALARVRHSARNEPGASSPTTVQGCLQAAAQVAPLPRSTRQLYRILLDRGADKDGVEVSVGSVR